ncbi:MAG: hypothetical protein KC657_09275 [Myxococcales bacterium]|nr:hypothetical protein [Myxococcales bacterium]
MRTGPSKVGLRRALGVALVGALLAAFPLAACNKNDPPPPPNDGPKKTEPVPTDMVLNDFLPSGGDVNNLKVRMEGGVPEAGGAAPAASGQAADEPAGEPTRKMKLLEPGAEPRVARKMALQANKTEKRMLEFRRSQAQEGGRAEERPPLALTMDVTPKDVKKDGAKVHIKLAKVEVPGAEKDKAAAAAVAQEFGALIGLTAIAEVSSRGSVGELSFEGSERVKKQSALEVIDGLQQAAEHMFPPLPDEPIGVGAKWEDRNTVKQGPIEQQVAHVFELTELKDDVATITAKLETKVPKRAVPNPRMPPGTTMQVDSKGTYTYTVRFDRPAIKVTGEMKTLVKIEAPVPDAPGGKQTINQTVTVSHKITTPAP